MIWHEENHIVSSPVLRQHIVFHAVAGSIFGYAILHPVSMIIFRALDHAPQHGSSNGTILMVVLESFQLEMLPMGFVFSAFCSLIGAANGYFRVALTRQKDLLKKELDENNATRNILEKTLSQIESLQESEHRTTRFMVHDLKTPLSCILGFSGNLQKRFRVGK